MALAPPIESGNLDSAVIVGEAALSALVFGRNRPGCVRRDRLADAGVERAGLVGAGWPARRTCPRRSSATRVLKVRIEYRHSMRSAITVAGIVGHACNNIPNSGRGSHPFPSKRIEDCPPIGRAPPASHQREMVCA